MLKRKRLLGDGTFGFVYLVDFDGKKLAAKEFTEKFSGEVRRNEIFINSYLNHPNILKILNINSDTENEIMLFEICEETLIDFMRLNQGRYANTLLSRSHMIQLSSAIAYLHSEEFVHCDIKPTNILLKNNVIKIIDFGMACHVKIGDRKQHPYYQEICTITYRAPELFYDISNMVSHSIDIWSIGVIFFEIMAGRRLLRVSEFKNFDIVSELLDTFKFSEKIQKDLCETYRISENLIDYDNYIVNELNRTKVSCLGIKLIMQCLEVDYKKRITAEDIIKHPFFEEIQ